MTIPVWPDDLPQRADQDGFAVSWPESTSVQKMDRGPAKTTFEGFALGDMLRITMRMSSWQRERFRQFYNEEIRRGATPFLMLDPEMIGVPLAAPDGTVLLTPGDVPLTVSRWRLVRLSGVSNDGVFQPRVSFSIEVLP